MQEEQNSQNSEQSPAPPQPSMNPEQANVQLNQGVVSGTQQNSQPVQSSSNQPSNSDSQKETSVAQPSSQVVKESPSQPKTVVPTISPSEKQAPKKMASDKKTPDKKRFIFGCAGIFLGLFIIFILLIVAVLSQAGGSNPVLQSLQIDPADLKTFLSGLIAVSFGSMAVIFLILGVIGLFRLIGAKKGDKVARSSGIRMTLLGFLPFALVVFIWFALVNFINRLNLNIDQVRAEIMVLSPDNLENLQAPIEVTFSAFNVGENLTSNGLNIESMDWDLDGDGNFETPITDQAEVTRLYTRRAAFNVGLRAKVSGEEEYRVYNLPLIITDAAFDAQPASGSAPLEVRFDATELLPTNRKVESLSWDFDGDGNYDAQGPNELTPRFTFTQVGKYQIHLRVIDEQSTVENYYREIEITPSSQPLLTSQIQAEPSLIGTVPLSVQFDGSGSTSLRGNVVNYRWNFGDGSAEQVGRMVSHVFESAGIFQVTLTVTDDEGRTADRTVEVEASASASRPDAVIQTTPRPTSDPDTGRQTLTGEAPLQVSFDASDSTDPDEDIVDYEWDFDEDGEVDEEGAVASFTFTEPGAYVATLIVTDAEGQESKTSLNIEVQNPGVRAMIQANPVEGVAPLTVDFDASGSSAFEGQIVSYEWDFGDNTAPITTGALVTHKYDQVGQYTATLTVLTNQNKKSTTTQQIFVRQISLQACFEPSRDTGIAPLLVNFDPKCTTGDAQTFEWNFGDGETSTARTPVHNFEAPGTYTITLEVSDGRNNVSTYQQDITAE